MAITKKFHWSSEALSITQEKRQRSSKSGWNMYHYIRYFETCLKLNIWTTTTWSCVWVVLPKPSWYEIFNWVLGMITRFKVIASYNVFQNLCDFIQVLIFVTISKFRKSPKLTNIVIISFLKVWVRVWKSAWHTREGLCHNFIKPHEKRYRVIFIQLKNYMIFGITVVDIITIHIILYLKLGR